MSEAKDPEQLLAEALRAQAARSASPAPAPPAPTIEPEKPPAETEKDAVTIVSSSLEQAVRKVPSDSGQGLMLSDSAFELLSGSEYGNETYPAAICKAEPDGTEAVEWSTGSQDRSGTGITPGRLPISVGWILLTVALLGLAAGAIAGLLSVF